MKKLYLLFILFSFSALGYDFNTSTSTSNNKSNTNSSHETNENLKDSRIGEQFIPMSKFNEDKSIGYSFIDRSSIVLHPYNKKIRVFNEVVNFIPPLVQENSEGEKITYRSIVIQHFANCDKKEIAKGIIQLFENYFGDGRLVSTNDTPNQWANAIDNNEQRRLLIVGCSLSIAH